MGARRWPPPAPPNRTGSVPRQRCPCWHAPTPGHRRRRQAGGGGRQPSPDPGQDGAWRLPRPHRPAAAPRRRQLRARSAGGALRQRHASAPAPRRPAGKAGCWATWRVSSAIRATRASASGPAPPGCVSGRPRGKLLASELLTSSGTVLLDREALQVLAARPAFAGAARRGAAAGRGDRHLARVVQAGRRATRPDAT